MKPVVAAAFAFALSGCAGIFSGTTPQTSAQASVPEPERAPINRAAPPNYQELALGAMPQFLPGQPVAGAEISELQPNQPVQPGDWFACVKTTGDTGGYFTVFYEDLRVREARRAVLVDGCEKAAYTPLRAKAAPPPAKKPAAKPAKPKAG